MAYSLRFNLFRRHRQKVQPLAQEQPPRAADPQGKKQLFPWRTLAALLLALLAQSQLEPLPLNPIRHPWPAILLYLLSIGLIVWAWWEAEISLPSLPAIEYRIDPLTARWGLATIALAVLLLSFVLFSGGLFNLINVIVWLSGVGLLVRAFLEPDQGAELLRDKIWRFFSNLGRMVKPSRWMLLVFLVFGFAVFFRVYRLAEIPAEPYSDHAEKLLDVYDVLQGKTGIFFPRNTGREAVQIYWTAAVSVLFGTGISFLSLKIGTALAGVATLPFIYLLGKEFGGRRTAILALLLAGISYWGNIISRIGLRYTFYPLFAAATLYFLLRGLRRSSRNDIITAGLLLGAGLHGYTAFRIMPFVVAIAFLLYWLHAQSRGVRLQSVFWFGLIILMTLMVFLPLLRYTLENPEIVSYRSLTRLTGVERELVTPVWQIFLYNFSWAMAMFNWDNGEIWAHSVLYRPALDLVSAALLIPGVTLVLVRYFHKRDWRDIFLILSIPLLMLPSIMSLAFPEENPSLNRTSAALIPVFILIALCLDAILSTFERTRVEKRGTVLAWGLAAGLIVFSIWQNYDLVFRQYPQQYRNYAWNSSEMGQVVREFLESGRSMRQVFILEYPYWVDSRLVAIAAGFPSVDPIIKPERLSDSLKIGPPKIFLINPDDSTSLETLTFLYPQGTLNRYTSDTGRNEFWVYTVPVNTGKP
jgi:4-amino-4-deoxy-L-arabinose transferase-like glycosyltransferase